MTAAAGWGTIRFELAAASIPDQVHACQTMTEVHTVSIVAKNKYSGKAGGRPNPINGGTNVRKPLTRVTMLPAMIFASRFALNGSSRHATIMAMGISINIAAPARAHWPWCGVSAGGAPRRAHKALTSAYRELSNAKSKNKDKRYY